MDDINYILEITEINNILNYEDIEEIYQDLKSNSKVKVVEQKK